MTASGNLSGLTAIVVLAAGYGQRMGRQKLLLPDATGEPIVHRTVAVACAAAARGLHTRVCVVCNPEFPSVASAISDLTAAVVWNSAAREGMSTSLVTGIRWAMQAGAARALVLLADQPEVDSQVVSQLVTLQTQTGDLVVQTRYNGVPGHPILFASTLFSQLQDITGDEGGRSVIQAHADMRTFVDVAHVVPRDVDTPDDYTSFLRRTTQ